MEPFVVRASMANRVHHGPNQSGLDASAFLEVQFSANSTHIDSHVAGPPLISRLFLVRRDVSVAACANT